MDWLAALSVPVQIMVILGIFIIGSGIVGTVIYLLLKGKIKANLKDKTISIGGENIDIAKYIESAMNKATDNLINNLFEIILEYAEDIIEFGTNNKIHKQMKYADRKLQLMVASKEANFYSLLKKNGVEQSQLTAHEDCQYYRQVVLNMVFSEDSIKSTKKILREYIKEEDYLSLDGAQYTDFVEQVCKVIKSCQREYLNAYYDSSVVTGKGEKVRDRIISNPELVVSEDKMDSEINVLVRDIFDNAKRIYKEIQKEKEEKLKKRKKEIRRVINLKGENDDIPA